MRANKAAVITTDATPTPVLPLTVNQVVALITVDSSGSGNFKLTIEGKTTGVIAYSATIATLKANINAALDATFGASAIVASGASLAALIFTFSGPGYSARPINGDVTVTLQSGATGFVMAGSAGVGAANAGTSTTVTTGVKVAPMVRGYVVNRGTVDGLFRLSGVGDWAILPGPSSIEIMEPFTMLEVSRLTSGGSDLTGIFGIGFYP